VENIFLIRKEILYQFRNRIPFEPSCYPPFNFVLPISMLKYCKTMSLSSPRRTPYIPLEKGKFELKVGGEK
jgi:hypothetical protein